MTRPVTAQFFIQTLQHSGLIDQSKAEFISDSIIQYKDEERISKKKIWASNQSWYIKSIAILMLLFMLFAKSFYATILGVVIIPISIVYGLQFYNKVQSCQYLDRRYYIYTSISCMMIARIIFATCLYRLAGPYNTILYEILKTLAFLAFNLILYMRYPVLIDRIFGAIISIMATYTLLAYHYFGMPSEIMLIYGNVSSGIIAEHKVYFTYFITLLSVYSILRPVYWTPNHIFTPIIYACMLCTYIGLLTWTFLTSFHGNEAVQILDPRLFKVVFFGLSLAFIPYIKDKAGANWKAICSIIIAGMLLLSLYSMYQSMYGFYCIIVGLHTRNKLVQRLGYNMLYMEVMIYILGHLYHESLIYGGLVLMGLSMLGMACWNLSNFCAKKYSA